MSALQREIREAVRQPRRLLNRVEAARYAGVCATTFDKMVRDGEMPQAKRCRSRKVWDMVDLDSAIDDLPVDGDGQGPANDWDDDDG